ncbi:hypothetical protein VHEMI05908 [[Torrubiella] hemipterigena]|uniref:Rhamnogalacturonase A/B/Epimerase-like pectate lyase domain-containing protein n=1 Tax=[Torrubiella] hemipterigena TaxID=1531966 RepID=A0A0A1T5M4_9HYPO|nr:hypothetical protein VHEMI05908 [[Torrubiella] hemipterigena]
MKVSALFMAAAAGPLLVLAHFTMPKGPVGTAVPLPPGKPQPAPPYAMGKFKAANGGVPDQGILNGPVLQPLNSTMLAALHNGQDPSNEQHAPSPVPKPINHAVVHHPALNQSVLNHTAVGNSTLAPRRPDYKPWWVVIAEHSKMPLAPEGYQYYRNIKDFGAKGDGVTDDTAAINRAAATMSSANLDHTRCGEDCGSTSVLQALVYFPEGTYLVSSPIVQYYHTVFMGDFNNKPVIKGSANFTGIALIDSNVYVPKGGGRQWYYNQSNFLRQIRNMVFDMTGMSRTNKQGDQEYVPTGIHWQAGQATSISNCDFNMPLSSPNGTATAVGILMENGSGGSISDSTFKGGNIGLIAGSQQFTAINLQFKSCLTAVKQAWNWGFTYKNIYIESCAIGFDCIGADTLQNGVGSISLLDSHFNSVPNAITISENVTQQPNLVLDNILIEKVGAVVAVPGKETLLKATTQNTKLKQWVSGYQYLVGDADGDGGKRRSGFIDPPIKKPAGLLDKDGNYFWQPKPTYQQTPERLMKMLTDDPEIKLDGTGDQTERINAFLKQHVGKPILFPAGIYQVKGTVFIPPNSVIIGTSWSQIRGTGDYFADENNPKVMVKVGSRGDQGKIEISDMLFTVKGNTAGAILMEWNIRDGGQGAAGMWDSHFRVGGAADSDLQLANCPVGKMNKKCQAASMIMHLTPGSSGYFDNMWLWVADHDLDNKANADTTQQVDGIPRNQKSQISVYSGRGMLIESTGPTWFYGTASEHNQLYQYQLHKTSNVFFGHMQTETPYYQPNPTALEPYKPGKFPADPNFSRCDKDDKSCNTAWALRVIESTDIVIYGAGLYSFFQDNKLGCTKDESCQQSMVETSFSERLWMYNIFTKGNKEIVSPRGILPNLNFDNSTRNGFTSEVAAWLPLALGGGDYGDDSINSGDDDDGDEDQIEDASMSVKCDLGREFNSLEELDAAADIPTDCKTIMAAKTMANILDHVLDEYKEVDKGYDDHFGYYETYMNHFAEEQIPVGATKHAQFFDCVAKGYTSGPCDAMLKEVNNDSFDMAWTLRDKTGFLDAMSNEFGILENWIKYGVDGTPLHCFGKTGSSRKDPGSDEVDGCKNSQRVKRGFPQKADNIKFPNPKEVIMGAGNNLQTLQIKIAATYADMVLGQWNGSYADAVEVLAIPVGLMQQAIESMKDVKAKAKAEEEEEKKKLTNLILTIVFAVVPLVGEFSATAFGFVGIARLIATIGQVANAALISRISWTLRKVRRSC